MGTYSEIFDLTLETIIKNSIYPRDKVLKSFERFRNVDFERFDDRQLYQVLAYIPFYAGLKSKTVTDKIDTIKKYFPDFETVAAYDAAYINRIMMDSKMIRHAGKINAAVENAKKVKVLTGRYGSFKKYLQSLNFNRSPEDLEKAALELKKTFAYMGPATTHHFLTEIGAKTIKPDRVMMRVLTRLKLVKSEGALEEARQVCNLFVSDTGYSHRFIDIVLVKLGHVEDDIDIGLREGICLEHVPRCSKCLLTRHCSYGR